MLKNSKCHFLFLFLLPGLVYSQEISTSDDIRSCAFILKSCRTKCEKAPNDYVKWTIDGNTNAVRCERKTRVNGDPNSNISGLLVVPFEVPCCPSAESCPSCPSSSKLTIQCLDDAKLNTLFILGVTTLACILLMCLFMCIGLLLFRQRNRSYKLDGLKEENQSLTKGSEKTSTTLTFSDCGHDNNTPSSSNTPPPKYKSLKVANAKNVNPNSDQTMINRKQAAEEKKERDEGEYINQDALLLSGPRSLIIRKDGFQVTSDGDESTKNSKVITARGHIPEDYEIRGGFVRPKRTSSQKEAKTARFAEADETKTETGQVASGMSEQETSSDRSSRHSNISDQQSDNPYVEAPPLKSLRSTTKFEHPGAYQTLLMESSNDLNETNEYNTLLHNVPVVPTGDSKTKLALNNNSRLQTNCKSNTYDVMLKPAANVATVAES